MADFRIPNRIIYGKGAVNELCSISCHRMLIVYDDPQVNQAVQKLLCSSDITVRTFYADPYGADIPQVKEGTKALMEFKPDWILAAGGYGAIDLAKLIRIFYQRPDLTVQDAIQDKATDIPLDKSKLIILPLFNTNGREATCSACVWDVVSMHQHEIRNINLMPDITIIDPEVLSLPKGERLAAGVLSTLVLSIDAASDLSANSFVRPQALEAISLLSQSIPSHTSAYTDKASLLYAQCLAGIAHSNSIPGLSSILCSALASLKPASFGIWGAAILPAVIRLDKNPGKYLAAAKAMELKDSASLADAVTEYADMLGLPLTLSEMGVNKNTFLKKLSKLSYSVLPLLPADIAEQKEPQKHIEQILRMAYSHKEL
ncbi:MAG: iron-containing alcohol dehydrogenase [Clostridia bacterium]|nr:iron-containing alcohol dehydrogenase [Clostridia bacterium]